MPDPHHITDDEYQRLIDQDIADDASNPWRVERMHREPPPPRKEPIGQRAQWKGHRWSIAPSMYCRVCQRLSRGCVCDPGFHE